MNHGEAAWRTLDLVRSRRPLVHTITSLVSVGFTTGALRAAGAVPVTAHAVEEAAELAMHADALVLDLGTPSEDWLGGMRVAIDQASHRGMPVVLDPDGAGVTAYRTEVALRLAAFASVLRGSGSEIRAMAAEAANRRVDRHADRHEAAQAAAAELALRFDCVVVVTGTVDRLTDGYRTLTVSNGQRLMSRVTGVGGALSGFLGACLAVEPDALHASAQACALFGLAGQIAAETAGGPGSLSAAMIDTIYHLKAPEVLAGIQIQKV